MSFSLNRFWLYTKSDITENRLMYLSMIVGSLAVMVLMPVLFNWLSWVHGLDQSDLKNIFYGCSAVISMLTICLAFWDIISKGKLINLVQRPASMFEKFIERILLFVFVFQVIQRLFFLIVEFFRLIFLPRFEGDWFMSLYGRGDGETMMSFFMDIDQAILPSIVLGLCVLSLAIYMSATFGGLKSFIHFIASFAFGLIAFAIFLIYMRKVYMPVNTDAVFDAVIGNPTNAVVLGAGSIFAAISLCVKSLISRNLNIPFKGIVGFLGMLVALAILGYAYFTMVLFILEGRGDISEMIMCSVGVFNALWLLWGAYNNFARRQLSV